MKHGYQRDSQRTCALLFYEIWSTKLIVLRTSRSRTQLQGTFFTPHHYTTKGQHWQTRSRSIVFIIMWNRREQKDRDYAYDDDSRDSGGMNRDTAESFERRRRWDPSSMQDYDENDNIDHDWEKASPRERKDFWDESLRQADDSQDWSKKHDERYQRKKEKGEKKYRKRDSGGSPSHVICVDDTHDAMHAFRHAAKNLPRDHRLILTHGLYEGLLGHGRADEERMHRVQSKFLTACSDLDVRAEESRLQALSSPMN